MIWCLKCLKSTERCEIDQPLVQCINFEALKTQLVKLLCVKNPYENKWFCFCLSIWTVSMIDENNEEMLLKLILLTLHMVCHKLHWKIINYQYEKINVSDVMWFNLLSNPYRLKMYTKINCWGEGIKGGLLLKPLTICRIR